MNKIEKHEEKKRGLYVSKTELREIIFNSFKKSWRHPEGYAIAIPLPQYDAFVDAFWEEIK